MIVYYLGFNNSSFSRCAYKVGIMLRSEIFLGIFREEIGLELSGLLRGFSVTAILNVWKISTAWGCIRNGGREFFAWFVLFFLFFFLNLNLADSSGFIPHLSADIGDLCRDLGGQ